MTKIIPKSLMAVTLACFAVGLVVYLSHTIENGRWNFASTHNFLPQYEWLIGLSFLAIIIVCIYRIRSLKKLTHRQYSIAEITLGLWLLTCLAAFITLFGYAIKPQILFGSSGVIISKIFLVFISYGIFTFLSIITGRQVLAFCKIKALKLTHQNLFGFGLGIILITLFFYLVSLVHWLNIYALIAYLAMALLFGRKYVVSLYKDFVRRRFSFFNINHIGWLSILMAVVFFIVMFFSIALPHPVGGDDLRSYYNLPATFIEQGSIVQFPNYIFNNAPHAGTYIYIPILFVGSFVLNYIGLYFLLATLLVLYVFSSTLKDKLAGWWAVLLMATLPWTYWFITTVKVDFLATFFISLGLLAILLGNHQKQNRYFVIGGLIFGVAVAIKYTSLYIAPGLIVASLLWPGSARLSQKLKTIMIILVFSVIAFSPWATRNYVIYNNVLYPFKLSHTVNNNYHYYATDSAEHRQLSNYLNYLHSSYTHGLNYANPWYLNLWHIFSSRSISPANESGPCFFLLMPLFVYSFFLRKTRPLAVLSLTTIILWYWVSLPQLWYMMSVLALLSVVYGVVLSLANRRIQYFLLAIILMHAILMIKTSRVNFVRYLLPNIDGREIISKHQSLDLLNYLNNDLRLSDSDYLIYDISGGGPRNRYLIDNFKHGYYETDSFSREDIFIKERPVEYFLNTFKQLGITHLHYSAVADDFWRDVYCLHGEGSPCFQSSVRENFQALKSYLELVFEANDSGAKVYKIQYEK
jgi:hypothetical protein